MASKNIAKRPNGKWRARYRDLAGKEHAKHFSRKVDAERWLDEVTAALVTGNYVDPKSQKMTVDQWCDAWLESYAHRKSTERQARVDAVAKGLGKESGGRGTPGKGRIIVLR